MISLERRGDLSGIGRWWSGLDDGGAVLSLAGALKTRAMIAPLVVALLVVGVPPAVQAEAEMLTFRLDDTTALKEFIFSARPFTVATGPGLEGVQTDWISYSRRISTPLLPGRLFEHLHDAT